MPKEYLSAPEVRTALIEVLVHLASPQRGISSETARTYAAHNTSKDLRYREWRAVLAQALADGEVEERGHRLYLTQKGGKVQGVRRVKLGVSQLRPVVLDELRGHLGCERAAVLEKIRRKHSDKIVSAADFRKACDEEVKAGRIRVLRSKKLRLR